jgi:hypothetical protein
VVPKIESGSAIRIELINPSVTIYRGRWEISEGENKGLLTFVRKKSSSNVTITGQAQAEGLVTAKSAVLVVQMNDAGETWDVPANKGAGS